MLMTMTSRSWYVLIVLPLRIRPPLHPFVSLPFLHDLDASSSTLTFCMQAGWLSVDGSVRPLYRGVNIIGRESEISDRNRERILQWQADHGGGGPVSVLLLRYASISSKHAIVCERMPCTSMLPAMSGICSR
jgi:hypothetical protein